MYVNVGINNIPYMVHVGKVRCFPGSPKVSEVPNLERFLYLIFVGYFVGGFSLTQAVSIQLI